ncbi:MAG: hypothetical protein K2X01_04585 [Cyanobacteria bacterium]|nr:hypothetical protein [Cyanobacteriota bacterium]
MDKSLQRILLQSAQVNNVPQADLARRILAQQLGHNPELLSECLAMMHTFERSERV